MHVFRELAIAFLFIFASQASATIIVYEYAFDTPQFVDPPFEPLNSLLQGVGPTVEGTITVDTDKVVTVQPDYELYIRANGGFTHTSNLDGLFYTDPYYVYLVTGSRELAKIEYWDYRPDINLSMTFEVDLLGTGGNDPVAEANCYDNGPLGTRTRCAGTSFINDSVDLTDVTVTQSVPEPTTLALMAFGFAGLSFARQRIKT